MSRVALAALGRDRVGKATRTGIMTASTGTTSGRIFMSYRREETAYPAAWLFDRLASHFGRDQIFKDVDSIELGDDFVEVITTAVGSCEVLLALIGTRWLTITDQDGHRRLDNPGDFVRLEIEAALTRNVRVIPILVDEARMPRADELPASLARLARRQALELSPGRFDADTRRLLRVLDRTISEAQEEARQEAERAARDREKIEQLQGQIRERAAAQDWDAVVAVNDELAVLDPAADDPDALASMAREQITRRHQAAEAADQREADERTRRDAGKASPGSAEPQPVPPRLAAPQTAPVTPASAEAAPVAGRPAGPDLPQDLASAKDVPATALTRPAGETTQLPAHRARSAARLVDAGFIILVIPLCVIALEALIRPQTFLIWPWWVIIVASILGIAVTLGGAGQHAVPASILLWVMTWSAVYSLSVIGTSHSLSSTLIAVLSTECIVAAVVSVALCIWIVVLLPKGIRSVDLFLAIFMGCFSVALVLAAVALHTGKPGVWAAVGVMTLTAALGVILTLIRAHRPSAA